MRLYALIFIFNLSFFQLFSMEKDNKEKSNCCACFEWLWCCKQSKSPEKMRIIPHNIQGQRDDQKIQKRNSQGTEDTTFIPFLSKDK